MESLALMVALIVAPAMFGGPIGLLLTLWRPTKMSRVRRISIYALTTASIAIGLYLIFGRISNGAVMIGFFGVATGVLALWRTRNVKRKR
jgi:disulfide bond formation protein DsbB